MKFSRAVALSFAVLLSISSAYSFVKPGYAAEPKSPIFGQASATLTSVDKNKSIVGKAYYADLYGYYGNLYNTYAGYYGSAGYYSGSNGAKYYYYYYASAYAYAAYYYYTYASYYAYYGQ